MNLLHSSDSNSIEIGAQVETPTELAELRRIVHQFLSHYKTPDALPIDVTQASVHEMFNNAFNGTGRGVGRGAHID